MEVWKDILNTNYQVSNEGRVKNKKKNTILKNDNYTGYSRVRINDKHEAVHRLVAKYFVSGYEENKIVNHKDGNKLNNNVNNLEWVTMQENISHAIENDLNKKTKKEKVICIYKDLISGNFSYSQVAKKYNTSMSTVARIKRKEAYSYITDTLDII